MAHAKPLLSRLAGGLFPPIWKIFVKLDHESPGIGVSAQGSGYLPRDRGSWHDLRSKGVLDAIHGPHDLHLFFTPAHFYSSNIYEIPTCLLLKKLWKKYVKALMYFQIKIRPFKGFKKKTNHLKRLRQTWSPLDFSKSVVWHFSLGEVHKKNRLSMKI